MKKKVHGFTLIEVILVLGVAGLIFALTIIVLPSLWASERDAARRDHIMHFVSQVKNFQTNNNRGALPSPNDESYFGKKVDDQKTSTLTIAGSTRTSNAEDAATWKGFYRDFFDDSFMEPNGLFYDLNIMLCAASKFNDDCLNESLNKTDTNVDGIINVVIGAVCDGEKPKKSANARRIAAVYQLEHGRYCYND